MSVSTKSENYGEAERGSISIRFVHRTVVQRTNQEYYIHSKDGQNLNEAVRRKEHQVIQAIEQGRALTEENLMVVICSIQNMNRAYKRVKSNKDVLA